MERREIGKLFRAAWGRYRYASLVILAGAVLLVWPWGSADAGGDGDRPAMGQAQSAADEEEQMRQILSRIEGVGKLELMLTAERTDGRELARDTELSYSGETAAPDDYDRRSTTVIVSGSGGGDEPVSTAQLGPVYRGALVVCQGAGDAAVRLAVIQAVSALTGLGSDRITVVKCQ